MTAIKIDITSLYGLINDTKILEKSTGGYSMGLSFSQHYSVRGLPKIESYSSSGVQQSWGGADPIQLIKSFERGPFKTLD